MSVFKKPYMHFFAFVWLAVLICALYGRSAAFEYTRTDDISLISNRAEFIQDLSNIPTTFKEPFFLSRRQNEGFYRPIATISLMLDAQWNGTNPKAFHITNIFLHILACWIFFLTLSHLKCRPLPSLAAVSIFAVHPVNTEAVCWIPGRIDILLTIFSLSSFMMFLKYCDNRKLRFFIPHLLFMLCALFTKEAAIVLPMIFLAYTLTAKQFQTTIRNRKMLLGWAACLSIWAGAWTTVISGTNTEWSTWFASLFRNARVIFMYLGKIMVPHKMAVLAITEDSLWIPGMLCSLTLGCMAIALRSDSRRLKQYLWGITWFLLLILPTLPVSGYQILENRIYMPAVGIVTSLLLLTEFALDKTTKRSAGRAAAALTIVIFSCFSVMSYKYSESFRNADTFTANAVKTSPHSALAHLNRGVWHFQAGQHLQAALHYQTAIELNPNQPNVVNNLGVIRMTRGEYSKAEILFRHELTTNPDSHMTMFNLGRSLRLQGKGEAGGKMIQKAVDINRQAIIRCLDEFITYYDNKGDAKEADWYRQFNK